MGKLGNISKYLNKNSYKSLLLFQIVNHHLLKDLTELDLWDDDMKNRIIANNGSIQNIEEIPQHIRDLYKTVWEISVKSCIKMAADRGAFIDQSQSFNIHVAEPNYGKLTSIHFYGWKMGLKTGMYYLRTKPAVNAIQFTVDKTRLNQSNRINNSGSVSGSPSKMNGATSTPSKANNSQSPVKPTDNGQQNGSHAERNRRMAEMVCSLENKEDCMMCGS